MLSKKETQKPVVFQKLREEVLPEDGLKDHLGESKLKEAENRVLAGVTGKGLVVPAGAGVGTKGGQPWPRVRRTC